MIKPAQPRDRHYVITFESELKYMAGLAHSWGNIETGGALFGLWTHGGRPLIMLATPPGPGAEHSVAHFAQNAEYVMALSRELDGKWGIQASGSHHSHHELCIDHPSSIDVEQIHRIASKNGIPRMMQFVLTFEQATRRRSRMRGWKRDFGRSLQARTLSRASDCLRHFRYQASYRDDSKVRIGAFLYPDAAAGPYVRCPIKTLPGVSPIRRALSDSEILRTPEGGDFKEFPLDRIIYDAVTPCEMEEDPQNDVSPAVIEQLERLESEIIDQVRLRLYEDRTVLLVPLSEGGSLVVGYGRNAFPLRICSAHIIHPDLEKAIDITNKILLRRRSAPLDLIHRYAEAKMRGARREDFSKEDSRSNCHGTKMIGMCEDQGFRERYNADPESREE